MFSISNNCNFMGRLTRDPEIRRTQSGKEVASFSLAVSTGYGEKAKVEYPNFTAWEGMAKYVSHFSKGDKLIVASNLESRTWTDKDGKERKSIEFVCYSVESANGKKGDAQPTNGDNGETQNTYTAPTEEFAEVADDGSELPF